MFLIQSHTYNINMDNCAYFRAGRPDEGMRGKEGMTIFTMNNGSVVQITCPYEIVQEQIELHMSYLLSHPTGSLTHFSYLILDY